MTEILIFVGAYFALIAALSLVVRPYRARINEAAARLRNLPLNANERRLVEGIVDSAYSVRAAPLVALAYLEGLVLTRHGLIRERDQFEEAMPTLCSDKAQQDLHLLSECQFVSAAAVNPIFGLLAYFVRWIFIVRLVVRGNESAVDEADYRLIRSAV